MKKTLALTLMTFAALTVTADDYDITTGSSSGVANAITSPGNNQHLSGSLKFYSDAYVSFQREADLGSDFGNWTADTISFSMYTMNQWGNLQEFNWAESNAAGSFEDMVAEGAFIGFAISNGETTIYSTRNTGNLTGPNGYAVDSYVDAGRLYIGFTVGNAENNEKIYYSIGIGSTPGGSSPNGQPLPGVIATALIGAGVLIRRKARK